MANCEGRVAFSSSLMALRYIKYRLYKRYRITTVANTMVIICIEFEKILEIESETDH
jgi:hypothetical protein